MFDFEPVAILTTKQFVGLGLICYLEIFRIPGEFRVGETISDDAQEQCFGQRSAVAEAGSRLALSQACVDPLMIVINISEIGTLVVTELFLWEQLSFLDVWK